VVTSSDGVASTIVHDGHHGRRRRLERAGRHGRVAERDRFGRWLRVPSGARPLPARQDCVGVTRPGRRVAVAAAPVLLRLTGSLPRQSRAARTWVEDRALRTGCAPRASDVSLPLQPLPQGDGQAWECPKCHVAPRASPHGERVCRVPWVPSDCVWRTQNDSRFSKGCWASAYTCAKALHVARSVHRGSSLVTCDIT
jgi:hypothetical protein